MYLRYYERKQLKYQAFSKLCLCHKQQVFLIIKQGPNTFNLCVMEDKSENNLINGLTSLPLSCSQLCTLYNLLSVLIQPLTMESSHSFNFVFGGRVWIKGIKPISYKVLYTQNIYLSRGWYEVVEGQRKVVLFFDFDFW